MDIIVTGSTGGIGHCIVKQAIIKGNINRIYCQYRNKEKFNRLFDANNPKMISEKHNATDEYKDSLIIQELYKSKPQELACISTMFDINPIKRIGTYSLKEIKENVSVNVLNMVSFINMLLQFKQTCNTNLRIINIDSGAAYKPLDGWGMYCASKAYVNMFFKVVQLENPDIKIVSYDPGVVDTQMQEKIRMVDHAVFGQVELFREYYNRKLLNSPDKIAEDIWKRYVDDWQSIEFKESFSKQ